MKRFDKILNGGDLRSIGKSNDVVTMITDQKEFDALFSELHNPNRKIVMRSADAIEKITIKTPEYLQKHKTDILNFCKTVINIEFKWHLALLVSRMDLNEKELEFVWLTLQKWATDKKESRIVRVNSLQSLFDLLPTRKELKKDFELTLEIVGKENIPSINARIRKLKKARN